MSNDVKPTTKELVENPVTHFDHPMDVTESPKLTDKQKKAALDRWEEDARRLAVATEEGMTGGEPSRMVDVTEAKTALGVEETERRPSPTKTG